jgi:hypothetical protein
MSTRRSRTAHALIFALLAGGEIAAVAPLHADTTRGFLDKYCATCHNQKLRTAGFVLDAADPAQAGRNPEVWERVVAKLHAGSMPPPGMPRPAPAVYRDVAISLENNLDSAWAARPNPGRMSPVHRLNRAEFNNAIRDLLR